MFSPLSQSIVSAASLLLTEGDGQGFCSFFMLGDVGPAWGRRRKLGYLVSHRYGIDPWPPENVSTRGGWCLLRCCRRVVILEPSPFLPHHSSSPAPQPLGTIRGKIFRDGAKASGCGGVHGTSQIFSCTVPGHTLCCRGVSFSTASDGFVKKNWSL